MKAISLNQIAKEEIKGTGYEIQSASGQSKAGGRTEKENAGSARGDHGHY